MGLPTTLMTASLTRISEVSFQVQGMFRDASVLQNSVERLVPTLRDWSTDTITWARFAVVFRSHCCRRPVPAERNCSSGLARRPSHFDGELRTAIAAVKREFKQTVVGVMGDGAAALGALGDWDGQ